MGFLRRAIDFVARPTHSRTMGLLIVFVLVVAVSLTVIVAQQQQQLRQRASAPMESPVCSTIDINTIPECTFSANSSNISCEKATDRCKIGSTVYECKE